MPHTHTKLARKITARTVYIVQHFAVQMVVVAVLLLLTCQQFQLKLNRSKLVCSAQSRVCAFICVSLIVPEWSTFSSSSTHSPGHTFSSNKSIYGAQVNVRFANVYGVFVVYFFSPCHYLMCVDCSWNHCKICAHLYAHRTHTRVV